MPEALKRRVGLGLLVFFGVGVMVGAGIYVLVGAVAGLTGAWAPFAFVLAALVALPSALSYAELSSRMPEAAGEAAFVEAGFGARWAAIAVGLAIVVAGTISAGAVLRGGVGYLTALVGLPGEVLILGIGAALTLVAVVGVLESLAVAALLTLAEVGGLLAVVWAGFEAPVSPDWQEAGPLPVAGLGGAVILCFFAFIGFEDMANLAEEVRDPTRLMPRGYLLAITIVAALYGLVSWAAVRAVPIDELAGSERPLALVWQAARGGEAGFLSAIAVLAALNGVLAQIVMAARVLFGLGKRSLLLAPFRHAHRRFGTPILATVTVGAGLIACALLVDVASLAQVSAGVLLAVFLAVNLALIRIKAREPRAPFTVPAWVPWAGALTALAAMLGGLA